MKSSRMSACKTVFKHNFYCTLSFYRKKQFIVFTFLIKCVYLHAINLIAFKPMSSFIADKVVMDGLTYDDVLLIPAYSDVLFST